MAPGRIRGRETARVQTWISKGPSSGHPGEHGIAGHHAARCGQTRIRQESGVWQSWSLAGKVWHQAFDFQTDPESKVSRQDLDGR